MGKVAILVKWPRNWEQTYSPPTHWGSMWKLVMTGPAVSEEKMFEAFSLYESMKKSDPWGGTIFYSRVII